MYRKQVETKRCVSKLFTEFETVKNGCMWSEWMDVESKETKRGYWKEIQRKNYGCSLNIVFF
jgi:hypothetical protein